MMLVAAVVDAPRVPLTGARVPLPTTIEKV